MVKTSSRRPKSSNTGKRRRKSDRNSKIIIGIVLALTFAAIGYYVFKKFYPEYSNFGDTGYDYKYEIRGIDLSHHNEVVNWRILKDKNIAFAYLKVTEGKTLRDKEYESNYKLAKENGICVGTYHFFSFKSSGEEQAKHFIREAICRKGDMRPTIDFEHSHANKYSRKKEIKDSVIQNLKVFERALSKHYGCYPIIYTNKECYELYIKDNFPHNPIWICDLTGEPKDDIKNWVIWQFSHKGKMKGFIGHVDLNYYRYSSEKFQELIMN